MALLSILEYELRLLFILVILLMLPRALETVDYNKAAEKTREKRKRRRGTKTVVTGEYALSK